jgi:hypothetical protein
MGVPNPLPLEARRVAWDRLWRMLLTPPSVAPMAPSSDRMNDAVTTCDPNAGATTEAAG